MKADVIIDKLQQKDNVIRIDGKNNVYTIIMHKNGLLGDKTIEKSDYNKLSRPTITQIFLKIQELDIQGSYVTIKGSIHRHIECFNLEATYNNDKYNELVRALNGNNSWNMYPERDTTRWK